MPINTRAKKKTPLPNAILKDKEFLRLVDVLVDCRSSDPEKARRAQDAAVEIAAAAGDALRKMRSYGGMIKADFGKFKVAAAPPPPPPRKHVGIEAMSCQP